MIDLLFFTGMYVVLATCPVVAGAVKAAALKFALQQRYEVYLSLINITLLSCYMCFCLGGFPLNIKPSYIYELSLTY